MRSSGKVVLFPFLSDKKGIELSVNFLVTFIIAIVLFSMGIVFAKRLFGGAQDITQLSQEQLDKKIEELFCTGTELVCLNTNSRTIKRGDQYILGVNVVNGLPNSVNFKLDIVNSKAFDKENTPIFDKLASPPQNPTPGQDLDIFPDSKEFIINPNQQERTGVMITTHSSNPPGRYIVDIVVQYDDGSGFKPYGDPQKFYVTIV